MRWIALLVLTTALVSNAFVQGSSCQKKQEPPLKRLDLSGYWAVSGMEGEKSYSAVCRISKLQAGYSVLYVNPTGSIKGVGQIKGEQFSVGWRIGEGVGSTVYVIKVGGKTLEGTWVTLPTTGGFNRETLTWLKELD